MPARNYFGYSGLDSKRGASLNRTAVSLLLALFLLAASSARSHSTSSVLRIYADENSDVHVVLDHGHEALVPHRQNQTGIEDAKIAADGRTAGWLVLYPNPANDARTKFDDISGSLVIWRGGRIIRTFDTRPTYWSWAFVRQGDQVAYHSGPLHEGPSSHCELRDVNTGRLLASWDGDLEKPDRPEWTKPLDH